jgi:hypothetical protein
MMQPAALLAAAVLLLLAAAVAGTDLQVLHALDGITFSKAGTIDLVRSDSCAGDQR